MILSVALAPMDNIGMNLIVFFVMEVKFGTKIVRLVYVQAINYGMLFPVMIHVVEEEFLMKKLNNVFVQLVIGIIDHVSFVLIHNLGITKTKFVYVNKDIGIHWLVSLVLSVKFGMQTIPHVAVLKNKIGMVLSVFLVLIVKTGIQ